MRLTHQRHGLFLFFVTVCGFVLITLLRSLPLLLLAGVYLTWTRWPASRSFPPPCWSSVC